MYSGVGYSAKQKLFAKGGGKNGERTDLQAPAVKKKAQISSVASSRKEGASVFSRGNIYHGSVLLALFMLCSLLYYFGELVDHAGWTSLHKAFFYSVHDAQRLFFLAPIIYAGYFFRVRGAIITTLAAFIVFLPRAFFISDFPDPLLRPSLFIIGAGVMGVLTGMIRNQSEERRLLVEVVKAEKEALVSIPEGMNDGVCIIGPDYKIRFINQSMVRDFGQGTGLRCHEFLHDFEEPCEKICKLLQVLHGETHRWDYTLPNGKTFEVVASPFVDFDGTVCQISIFRNITERKKVEQELIEINQLKSDLLSNVSHELKSPLTSIKGIISSLLQKDISLDESTKEMFLKGIGEEVDRLSSLVTNLLNMSKLDAGVWKPDKELCFILDIIQDVIRQQKWVHKTHAFETEIAPNLPEVFADYNQIRQVLLNLVENAAAYSSEGTKITLKASIVDGMIRVSVSDQGTGIPKEELEKIFEKFYRGSQRRQRPGGTGLGLAISQAIIQNHGGKIWAESEVSRGSTLHFTLPLARKASR
jgi:signal transduction histidine kinase